MTIHKTNLTDDEFVRSLHDRRPHSPVIDELCTRLEMLIDNEPQDAMDFCCPVCDADLEVKQNGNGVFELKISE